MLDVIKHKDVHSCFGGFQFDAELFQQRFLKRQARLIRIGLSSAGRWTNPSWKPFENEINGPGDSGVIDDGPIGFIRGKRTRQEFHCDVARADALISGFLRRHTEYPATWQRIAAGSGQITGWRRGWIRGARAIGASVMKSEPRTGFSRSGKNNRRKDRKSVV